MIESLTGAYIHEADHSMAAKWRPNPERPFYAAAVYQASIVSWVCTAEESIQRKARHFRATLAKAEDQLPADRPGVIHIGIETAPGADVAETRHIRNWLEASSFNTSTSRLRWVYASYFVPEITTAPNESWAITETTAPYKVGSHNTKWPLPDHLLLSPESDFTVGGVFGPRVCPRNLEGNALSPT